MPSCIFTTIKNEHLYLDEWITYHLNMGVPHIYILEDLNSDSHAAITAKYGSQVSLFPPLSSDLLTPAEIELVQTNRAKNIPGGQKTYTKAALRYIQSTSNYDWCFVIDNDEFLVLDNSEPLNNILSHYQNYDALLLSWKCYGANGLINIPDYTHQTVVGTFTEPIHGRVPVASRTYTKKVCYNLHTYHPDFFNTIHIPSQSCNYCNTDYEKDGERLCYTNLYLNHYITRSFEEYIWKKYSRGYFMGFSRTFEGFFVMNPDMLSLKPLLLSILHETLVILPYSQRGSQGNELRLALRGWRKFCQFKYHFVVIGEFDPSLPSEFPWVQFIPVPNQPHQLNQYNPHLDIQHKLEVAYNLFHNHYPAFIYMADDNYAIKPFTLFDILKPHYLQPSFTGVESLPTSYWKHDKWKTRQLLDSNNLPHINYTTHFPRVFEFEKWHELWDRFDMRNESYVPEDVYFNAFPPTEPAELAASIRLGLWQPSDLSKLPDALANPNIKFLCNSVEGWSPDLEAELNRLVA